MFAWHALLRLFRRCFAPMCYLGLSFTAITFFRAVAATFNGGNNDISVMLLAAPLGLAAGLCFGGLFGILGKENNLLTNNGDQEVKAKADRFALSGMIAGTLIGFCIAFFDIEDTYEFAGYKLNAFVTATLGVGYVGGILGAWIGEMIRPSE